MYSNKIFQYEDANKEVETTLISNFSDLSMAEITTKNKWAHIIHVSNGINAAMGRKKLPIKNKSITPKRNQLFAIDPGYNLGQLKGTGTPSLPVFEIALYTTFEQRWELKGYSRGDLLSSIPLGPQEEVNLEISSWSKNKVLKEDQFDTEFESTQENNLQSKTSLEVTREIGETLGTELGVEGSFTMPDVPLSAAAEAGITSQTIDNLESSLERALEATLKAADKVKQTQKVRIVETTESGNEKKTVRKIKNHNTSRDLTYHYFEVLEHYTVSTQIKDLKNFCLLVDNPSLGPFTPELVLAHEAIFKKSLLDSTYKDGFDAALILIANKWFEEHSQAKIESNVTQGVTVPDNTEISSTQQTNKLPNFGIIATARTIFEILDEFVDQNLFFAAGILFNHYSPSEDNDYSADVVQSAEDVFKSFSYWERMKIVEPGFEAAARKYVDAVAPFFNGENPDRLTIQEQKDEINRQILLLVDNLADGWLIAVKTVALSTIMAAVMLLLTAPIIILAFPTILLILGPSLAVLMIQDNDGGLSKAIDTARTQLKEFKFVPRIELEQVPQVQFSATGQMKKPQIYQVYSARELATAAAKFRKLKLHMEANRTHYQNEFWSHENPNERLKRLEYSGITKYIDNRIVGFSGLKAMYPIKLSFLPKGVEDYLTKELIGLEKDSIRLPPDKNISMPTGGIQIVPILGLCDTLEPQLIEKQIIENERRKIENDKEKAKLKIIIAEEKRLIERLAQTPPVLDNPFDSEYSIENAFLEDDE